MGPLGVLGNLVWLLLAGWWLALGHLITTVLLACTIVGIPFAWAHVKLAGLALWPIGKMIVPHRTRPCDTRAGGDAIMLSCRNEMTRRTGRRGGGTSKKARASSSDRWCGRILQNTTTSDQIRSRLQIVSRGTKPREPGERKDNAAIGEALSKWLRVRRQYGSGA
jgi:hypothetical protein